MTGSAKEGGATAARPSLSAPANKKFNRWFGLLWQGSGAEHRLILRGLIAVGVFAFVGKLAGAAKEMAVAWRFGVSAEVDAYLFVLNLVNWPVALWFGVLTVILIPLAARLRNEAPDALRRFRAELLALTLIIGCSLALLSLLLLPRLISSEWVGLPPRTAMLAARMVPVLAWLVVPGLLVGLYSIWTMSAGGHSNTLLEGVPAVAILLGVLLTGGVGPLIWGTLAGTVVQLGFLAVPVRLRGDLGLPAFSLSSPQWTPFWRGFGLMMLGQGIMSLTTLIDQFFAAHLAEGAISMLGYATRIIALLLGVVATAVTRATLPVFSRSGATEAAATRRLAVRWAQTMFLAGVVAAAAGWVLAPWAVRLLFQRGTFTADDTLQVAHLLRYGLLQLPFYFSGMVLVSLHSSLGHYKLLLMTGILGLSVKVVASYLLIGTLGVSALMLSLVAVYGANTLLLAKAMPR